jgi:hypothetical protein
MHVRRVVAAGSIFLVDLKETGCPNDLLDPSKAVVCFRDTVAYGRILVRVVFSWKRRLSGRFLTAFLATQ